MNPIRELKKIALNLKQLSKKAKDDGWPKDLKEGRFTTYCKRQGFEGPCKSCVEKAMKSNDASVRGMAMWYNNTVLKQKGEQVFTGED